MAKYTTEVRSICETYAGLDKSVGYMKVDEVIQKAIPKVFDFDFPIFEESYRNVLETKILKHYYTREIGLETVGLWKLKLETKLNEIMPFYNRIYRQLDADIKLFDDVDYTTVHLGNDDGTQAENHSETGKDTINRTNDNTRTEKGTTDSTVNNESKSIGKSDSDSWDNYSDTPQGGLTGIREEKYLTNSRHIVGENNESGTVTDTGSNNVTVDNSIVDNGTSKDVHDKTESGSRTSTFKNTTEWAQRVHGRRGGLSYIEMFNKFIDNVIDVDLAVIKSLEELFMSLW